MRILSFEKKYQGLYFLLFFAILVNCSGLFITIIAPDGALYASIAKTMVLQNNFIELFAEGRDWLDKPHLPFWVTALFFKIFGFTSWAYKLPAILFLLMAALYTYRVARLFYKKEIALWASIIFLTAQHIIISSNDVRAEPYLTAFVIAAIYHFVIAQKENGLLHLIVGSLFCAGAIMTKGIFALIPIAGAVCTEMIVRKDWRSLFNLRWVWALLLIFIFIIPVLYCLWYQFDSHPEKIVFGKTGVSGIRFFFWDSQFGRFLNNGPIKGKGDPFFFFHTLLWAFLPWSILLYGSLFFLVRNEQKKIGQRLEWLTIGGSALTFIIFSFSRFQLPHYINIIFPLLAIITAEYIDRAGSKTRFVAVAQTILIVLFPLLALAIYLVANPGRILLALSFFIAGMGILLFLYFKRKSEDKYLLLVATAAMALLINLFMNTIFYPWLLHYQSGSEAARFVNDKYPGAGVTQLNENYSYPLEFYLNDSLTTINTLAELQNNQLIAPVLYLPADSAVKLPNYTIIKTFENFPVSRLNGKFLNPESRSKELKTFVLMINNSVAKN